MMTQILPLLGALRRISQSLDTHSKFLEQSAGLTLPQALVLAALRSDDAPLSAGRLAERVSLTQGTVTAILDRLETKQLVSRVRAADDKRRVLVALTERGRAAIAKTPPLVHVGFMRSFERISEAERDTLLAAVEKVAALMRAVDGPEPLTGPAQPQLPDPAQSMETQ